MKSNRLLPTNLAFSTCALSASLLLAICLPQSADAAVIAVVNGSFEASTGYDGGSPPTIPGWTQGSAFGQVENVSTLFTAGLTGVNAVYVGGNMQQTTGAIFVTGETYTFSLDIGRPNTNPAGLVYGVTYGFRNAINSDFLGIQGNGFETNDATDAPSGTFLNFTVSYTALASDAGNPVILGINDFFNGNNSEYIDNVTVTTTALLAPEPSTFLFVTAGFAGLAMFNRRRLGNSLIAR